MKSGLNLPPLSSGLPLSHRRQEIAGIKGTLQSLPEIEQDAVLSPMPSRDLPDIQKLWRQGQHQRRYAKALNRVEDRKLQETQRQMELSLRVMEDSISRQQRSINRILENIEERQNMSLSQNTKISTNLNDRSMHFSRHHRRKEKAKPTKLPPNICGPEVKAFSYQDEAQAPLGRWVRYPHYFLPRIASSVWTQPVSTQKHLKQKPGDK